MRDESFRLWRGTAEGTSFASKIYIDWHVRILCQFLQPQPHEHSGVPSLFTMILPTTGITVVQQPFRKAGFAVLLL